MVLGNLNEFRKRSPERVDSAFECEVCRTVTGIKHSASQLKPRTHLVEELHKPLKLQGLVFLRALNSARDALPIWSWSWS